ncbi:MAG: hypothetical protein Q4A34_03850 [Candidatus Saccharibacteria bacterium]|nr:hypothetical protein [Candidatus Saccharibacteria bacterium]
MASESIGSTFSERPSSAGDGQSYEHDVVDEGEGDAGAIYEILEDIREEHLNMFPRFPYGVFDEGVVREWVIKHCPPDDVLRYSSIDRDGLWGIYNSARCYHEKAEELSGRITEIVSGLQGLAETEVEWGFDAIYAEIMRRIGDMSKRSLDTARAGVRLQVARIFPDHAEVNMPDGYGVSIPTVKRWKRDRDIIDVDEACGAYVAITSGAKQELLAAIDAVPPPEIAITSHDVESNLEIPEDPFIARANELLEQFIACVNDEGGRGR